MTIIATASPTYAVTSKTPTDKATTVIVDMKETSSDQNLIFKGVSTPGGNMILFEQQLENNLNIIYSRTNLATLAEDDEFRSLSDAKIELTVTALEQQRFLVGIEDANMVIQPNHRQLQAEPPQFIVIYDQTTTYIARQTHPYQLIR